MWEWSWLINKNTTTIIITNFNWAILTIPTQQEPYRLKVIIKDKGITISIILIWVEKSLKQVKETEGKEDPETQIKTVKAIIFEFIIITCIEHIKEWK